MRKKLAKKKAAVCENAAIATACEKRNQGGGRFVFLEMGLVAVNIVCMDASSAGTQ